MSLSGGDGPAEPGPPRDRAQREAAFSGSVQAGAAWRYGQLLREAAAPNEAALDRLFDFRALMTRKGDVWVLPPVAVAAGRAVRLESATRARGQERSYRLAEKARMALGPPDWREYLYPAPDPPADAHPSILPSSAAESRLWRERVGKGWRTGAEEGEALFRGRAALLARDYAGMILYQELQGERLAAAPEVSVRGRALDSSDEELIYMLTDYGLEGRGAFTAGAAGGPGRTGGADGGAGGMGRGEAGGGVSQGDEGNYMSQGGAGGDMGRGGAGNYMSQGGVGGDMGRGGAGNYISQGEAGGAMSQGEAGGAMRQGEAGGAMRQGEAGGAMSQGVAGNYMSQGGADNTGADGDTDGGARAPRGGGE
jgi:hypothetical protein